MLNIGEFARLGQVSVRMLRHYDGIGLLNPAQVDPWSGYRYYAAVQLHRLNRIIALKGLGFTLEQVRSIVDAEVSGEELRGMLRLRRAELAERIAQDRYSLDDVERRLRIIEREGVMSQHEFVVKPLAATRVASLNETVGEVEQIGQVVGPLFERLESRLREVGAKIVGPAVACYGADGENIRVQVGFPFAGAPDDTFSVEEVPAEPEAATLIHRGAMDSIGESWQALAAWVAESGYELSGVCREVYLETPMDDQSKWVTELQQPFRRP